MKKDFVSVGQVPEDRAAWGGVSSSNTAGYIATDAESDGIVGRLNAAAEAKRAAAVAADENAAEVVPVTP